MLRERIVSTGENDRRKPDVSWLERSSFRRLRLGEYDVRVQPLELSPPARRLLLCPSGLQPSQLQLLRLERHR